MLKVTRKYHFPKKGAPCEGYYSYHVIWGDLQYDAMGEKEYRNWKAKIISEEWKNKA